MLSLCMIVKNEAKALDIFLNNVKDYVDEIIIVDSGSKDKTKEISKKYTKKVYSYVWKDDFAAARNFSISKATQKWILVLDPDEVIAKKDLIKIKELIKNQKIFKGKFFDSLNKNTKNKILGYRLIQKTYYKNKIISIRGICRLFINNNKIKFIYPIHETVRESIKKYGKIAKSGIIIKHYPKLNKEKNKYYMKLLKDKKKSFPNSNVDKEIENEELFFQNIHNRKVNIPKL